MAEFRECLTKYEILLSSVPSLVAQEIFIRYSSQLINEMRQVKSKHLENLSKFDVEKITNESMLKPNLGHPNLQTKLDSLNKKEIERQLAHHKAIAKFSQKLRLTLAKCADNFLKVKFFF